MVDNFPHTPNHRLHFINSRPSHQKFTNNTRSHHSFIKSHQHKIQQMLQINQKYEQDLIKNHFYQIRQHRKYSPLKISNKQKQKSNENLSPIKIRKSISSKQKNIHLEPIQICSPCSQNNKTLTLFGKKFTQKKIIENQSSLPEIPTNQIIISTSIQFLSNQTPNRPLIGFWVTQNKMVSLFPITTRKIDKIPVINQAYILPMLGSLTVKNHKKRPQKFIVTELYQSNSLKDILNQFQNLDETTVKTYLRKVILCIWNLHKNRIAHNRLSLQAFITTEKGDLYLNMLKSSTKSLNEKEKYQNTHYFPPQMLLSRTNCDSLKNDIWAIGCIALQLLTNSEPKNSSYHPYNHFIEPNTTQYPINVSPRQISPKDKKQKFLASFQNSRVTWNYNFMNDSQSILQKVKRFIEGQRQSESPQQSLIAIELCQSIVLRQISPLAADLIKKCLNVKLQKRPTIDELMFHPFLK